jgi:hypothetical protein
LAFTASRLAFLYVNGSFPEGVVRHKNGKNIDNRWKNLEEIDIKDVLKSRCLDRRNTSGYTGVYFPINEPYEITSFFIITQHLL